MGILPTGRLFPERKPTARWRVETWLHKPSGTMLAVYYDKAQQEFWSRVASEEICAPTQEKARRLTHAAATRLLCDESKWRRVIFVCVDPQFKYYHERVRDEDVHDSPTVGFKCLRTWVRDDADGQRYMRAWVRDERKELAEQRDVESLWLPIGPVDGPNNNVELPYSDEAWDALLALSASLEEARVRLDALVRTEDFLPRLLAASGRLLPLCVNLS